MKKIKLNGRQGDVWIEKVHRETASKMTGLKPIPREGNGLILAHGEVTGHTHSIAWDCLEVALEDETGEIYFSITGSNSLLVHETHDPIKLERGHYKSWIQREYSPEEIRAVAD